MVSRSYQAMRKTKGPCVLLESTSPASPLARRNLLARSPRAVLVASGTGLVIATPEGSRPVPGDAFAALRSLLREVRPGRWPSEGGVAGVLAYDAARPGPGAPTPRLVALAVDRFLVEDDEGVSPDHADGAPAPWVDAVLGLPPGDGGPPPEPPLDLERFSNMTREEHARLVRAVQEHIAAGDIYQANLSQRSE